MSDTRDVLTRAQEALAYDDGPWIKVAGGRARLRESARDVLPDLVDALTQARAEVAALRGCAGCEQRLVYPHQHATSCPVFTHSDVHRLADFIECGCGHLSVSYVDHNSHLEHVARETRK